jgi:transcriptional regulator with XRE-family HTH domain
VNPRRQPTGRSELQPCESARWVNPTPVSHNYLWDGRATATDSSPHGKRATGTALRSWEHVGQQVDRRITELGMTKAAVARRAGVDTSTLWKVRTGSGAEVSKRTLERIDKALRWPAGTITAVRNGQDPPTAVLTDPDRLDRLEDELADLTQRLEDVARMLERGLGPDA